VLFLNVDVFKREYESTWTNFLEIRSPPFFRNIPGNVVAALTWIHDTCCLNTVDSAQSPPEVVILPFDSAETLVPLAGALLEYPVAFVPPNPLTETCYFAGEALDFFEVTLRSLTFGPPSTLYVRFKQGPTYQTSFNLSLLALLGPLSSSHAQRPLTRVHLLRD